MFVGSWLACGILLLVLPPGWSHVAAAVCFASPFVGFARHLRVQIQRISSAPEHRPSAEPSVSQTCPTCGGHNELAPEDASSRCGYCGGTLVTDATVRDQLLQTAARSAQAAVLHARHERWRTAARTRRDPPTRHVGDFVIGGLGLLWILGAAVGSIRFAVVGGEPNDLVAIDTVAGLILVGLVGRVLGVRRARQSWRKAIDTAATEHGARRFDDLDALAEWLTAHWTDEFPESWICGGSGYAGFHRERGSPFLVSVAPYAESALVQRHVRVVLPGGEGRWRDRARDALATVGFRLETSVGGVVGTRDLGDRDDLISALGEVSEALLGLWSRER